MTEIRTQTVYPPPPIPNMVWQATDEHGNIAYGLTKRDAVRALMGSDPAMRWGYSILAAVFAALSALLLAIEIIPADRAGLAPLYMRVSIWTLVASAGACGWMLCAAVSQWRERMWARGGADGSR